MTTDPIHEADELRQLQRMWVDRDLPSGRRRQLREFLMNEIYEEIGAAEPVRRRPPRRLALTASVLGAAVAAGLAIAAGIVVAGGPGTGDAGSGLSGTGDSGNGVGVEPGAPADLSPAAQVLERAAAAAAAKPFTPPRSDQWIYTKNRRANSGQIAADKGMSPDRIDEQWQSADGTRMAAFNEFHGRVESWAQDNEYPVMYTLPTDPQELLLRLRARITEPADANAPPPLSVAAADVDGYMMQTIAAAIGDYDIVLPPAVTGALWRAVGLLPGLTEPETIEVAGRQVIAIGRAGVHSFEAVQLLIDPDTYEYIGSRYVVTEDFSIVNPEGQTITERAGTVTGLSVRLAVGLVGHYGQTA